MLPRSMQLLLKDVIDYAGVFPPARLELGEAVRNFMLYRTDPCSWIVGQFVCPVGLLRELETYDEWFGEGVGDVFITATGRSGQSVDEWLANFEADIISIESLNSKTEAEKVASFEVKLPKGLIEGGQLSSLLKQARAATTDIDVFYELPIVDLSETGLSYAVEAIRGTDNTFLKFRTGGMDADAFPDARTLAVAIAKARDAGLAFKATAGLHHPLPKMDDGIGARMHGFLNLLCAAILAKSRGLQVGEIEAILDTEDPRSFIFDEDGFQIAGQRASADDISAGRCFVLSFGSCSVDEPVQDLAALGYEIC